LSVDRRAATDRESSGCDYRPRTDAEHARALFTAVLLLCRRAVSAREYVQYRRRFTRDGHCVARVLWRFAHVAHIRVGRRVARAAMVRSLCALCPGAQVHDDVD